MIETIPWLEGQAPPELDTFYTQFVERLDRDQIDSLVRLFKDRGVLQNFHHVLSCSIFFQQELIQRPEIFLSLIDNNHLNEKKDPQYPSDKQLLSGHSEQIVFDRELRKLRARTMLRIIWRDLTRQASLQETTQELSSFAVFAINAALDFHYRALSEKHGSPRCKEGKLQPLVVLGMGKLGAGELNLSSDIDLIFAFPKRGSTEHPTRSLNNEEFFTRLGKKLIQSLDTRTVDGIVFRVDMRLRPYGQSGALVHSFNALEEYYQNQGREWERYAMVKASVVANNGDPHYSTDLMNMLQSFTYRKYVDYSVIEALRSLKYMIRQEVKRRRLEEDVKLGDGGIREIEFTAQVFQLIRGGRETHLQDNRILHILPALAQDQCLPEKDVQNLIDAYHFLRNTEHAIQAYADKQTQKLPGDKAEQEILAKAMGFSNWSKFYAQLQTHRNLVKGVFDQLIAAPEHDLEDTKVSADWQPLWQGRLSKESALQQLSDADHDAAETSFGLIADLRDWLERQSMHASSRARLDIFMPEFLAALAGQPIATELLRRSTKLIKSIARRSAYLLLLIENPKALEQLLVLSAASPWFADLMAEHPALLDELLDARALFYLPTKDELRSELQRSVLRIAEDDLEAQMENVRYFRSSHALRVAACELTSALPLMNVSDYLTIIAEVILEYVLQLCWHELVTKYGWPDGEVRQTPKFIIVAYGKLGGIELGHGSDLDLVFIHDASLNGQSDGERAVDNQTFFTRLGQKIIHFLTTNMSSGPLYEVDMRLRPSGSSGMLVTSLSSFTQYQENAAWTWEHQALVRARVVAGDEALAQKFLDTRTATLCHKRALPKLATEVVDMRKKMRDHLASGTEETDTFHLKHDAGGIVDIEFMVQYGVLAWAHSHPAITEFTDNIRILESFADANLFSTQEVEQLIEAYKAFRAAGHRLALQQQENRVAKQTFVNERRNVTRIWQKLFAAFDDASGTANNVSN